ncbi:glycosyl transferase, group 1 [Zunongwangia profunda SM-A87]|uniref:Glycosyl transferase, group 1 n=1 Tax=Zunongwangia profunda (strain DSM 18752 / CCTCC AB 206139 / SM-A87) TaxID=655815 RepID=D5BEE3_ZUNPS|nr:glycosyltransferase family 4 protein [Zunongwangia profunda]ADF52902.1 glycosyl transferase, group 1 [Zunongwangia profunda SM-A87]
MKNLLVIGYVWPEPTSSAAGSRMLQLLHFFLAENYNITFATTATQSQHAFDLKTLGIETTKIELNNTSFDNFLKKIQPEIVLFDRFMIEEQYGWRVDVICPEAIKILDTEDLHFLRNARKKALRTKTDLNKLMLNSDVAKREIASIYRCDLSLIISKIEMDLLTSIFKIPAEVIEYLPYLLDTEEIEKVAHSPSFQERQDFMFIGNFLHEPNWQTTLHLKQKIWPEIKQKLPEAKLHIYGAYASDKVYQLQNKKEGFVVHGRADTVDEVMQNHRILLAPIQFGAGLKGKMVDAMQNGLVSVTTPIGAEGISENHRWNGFICTSDDEIIDKAIQIYHDEEEWISRQKLGKAILKDKFSALNFTAAFQEKLIALKKNLTEHRSKNFIGTMLKFHNNRSTYFMSKFIEEKEKNKRNEYHT